MTTFEDAWVRFHQGYTPLRWLLRNEGLENWIRFHSLPQSKRYAETDDEQATILARQNILAAEVLGTAACWLVQASWTAGPGGEDLAHRYWPIEEYGLEYAFEVDDDDEDDFDVEAASPWRIHAAKTVWSRGQFDRLLLAIADDKVGPILWMGSDGAIFTPYDGGVDLFLPSIRTLARLRHRYSDWLPNNPLGL